MKSFRPAILIMVIAFGVILGGPVLGYLTDKTFAGAKRPLLSAMIIVQVFNWSCLVFLGPSLGSISPWLYLFHYGNDFSRNTLFGLVDRPRRISSGEVGHSHGLPQSRPPSWGWPPSSRSTGYLMDRVGKIGGAFSPLKLTNMHLAYAFLPFPSLWSSPSF